MPMIEFTEKDILRGTIVEPAWYHVKIDEVGEKLSKGGDSTNYLVEGTIISNADNGDTQFASVPVSWNFNSKAPGFMVGFFESLGYTVEAGKRFDLDAVVNESLDIFIENDMYEGRKVNRVNHKYRAHQA